MIDIKSVIPHREPFLFVDQVVELSDQAIITKKTFRNTEKFYLGHYPDYPITPGVILCESVFQSAAILILKNFPLESSVQPVLARIENARFKAIVYPDEELEIQAKLKEKCGKFFLMDGQIFKTSDRSPVLKVEFSIATTQKN